MTDAISKASDIIKEFEGLRLKAYLCPAGIPTIGYGATGPVEEIENPEHVEAFHPVHVRFGDMADDDMVARVYALDCVTDLSRSVAIKPGEFVSLAQSVYAFLTDAGPANLRVVK